MDKDFEWTEAEAAVGKYDAGSDWELKPEHHASELPPRAGALKRVLERHTVRDIMQRYRAADKEAGHQQKRYRTARRWLVLFAYAAAILGVFALSLHLFVGYHSDLQIGFVIAHVACLALVLGYAMWINRVDPRKKWLEARGEAELLRTAFFNQVTRASEPVVRDKEIALLPLQLAYFRRYQLDVQLRYFSGRGKELTQTAGLSFTFTAFCALIAIAALVLAGVSFLHLHHEQGNAVPDFILPIMEPQQLERLTYWAFLALAASTVYAVLATHQNVSEDQRNGTRYLSLYENLKFLKSMGYETARKAAENGDRETVEKFISLIQDKMVAEQSEWVSLQRIVESDDRVLASSTADGLTELFADRFGRAAQGAESSSRTP